MKMLADVKDSVLVGWNGDKHCLRLKGLKREKNGQAEHAVSMPLREGQERLDIVAVPLAVDEGRKRCRPFVVGVPSEQFLHFSVSQGRGLAMCTSALTDGQHEPRFSIVFCI